MQVARLFEPAPICAASIYKAEFCRHGSDSLISRIVQDVGRDHALVVLRHASDVCPGVFHHVERFATNRQEDVDVGVHGRTPRRAQPPMGTQIEVSTKSVH